MKLIIITPTGILYEGGVTSVTLPGVSGSFDILPSHAPLITALKEGVIRYCVNDKENEQPISGGFIKVENDEISVCIE